MYKRFLFTIVAFLLALVLAVAARPTLAKNSDNNSADPEIPERDGTYDVPGHPNLKVRVFVHNPKQESSPATTCPDPTSTATVHPAGWHLKNGDWKYYINEGSAPSSIGSSNTIVLTDKSFAEWSTKTKVGTKVNFINAGNTSINKRALDGKNIITWGRTQGTALAVTYTWYYTATHEVAENDTIMNSRFSWSWTPYVADACGVANTYDAENILTHELGHWMGLNDEYDTTQYGNATMYGYGAKGELKKDTISDGDIAGVNAIY